MRVPRMRPSCPVEQPRTCSAAAPPGATEYSTAQRDGRTDRRTDRPQEWLNLLRCVFKQLNEGRGDARFLVRVMGLVCVVHL